MTKFLPKVVSGLKFFTVVMAIAVADSLILNFFFEQIRSKYIIEAALSYHREFIPFLEEIIESRKIIVASNQRQFPLPPPIPAQPPPTKIPFPPPPPPTIIFRVIYAAMPET